MDIPDIDNTGRNRYNLRIDKKAYTYNETVDEVLSGFYIFLDIRSLLCHILRATELSQYNVHILGSNGSYMDLGNLFRLYEIRANL